MQEAALDGSRDVVNCHFGGGTPTFLSHDEMRRLMDIIREHFRLLPAASIPIEVDPRKVDRETVKLLGELGFNRMSVVCRILPRCAGGRQSRAKPGRNQAGHRRGPRVRLQVRLGRPDLRTAEAECKSASTIRWTKSSSSIPIACRSTTMRTCPAWPSRSGASMKPICHHPMRACRSCNWRSAG